MKSTPYYRLLFMALALALLAFGSCGRRRGGAQTDGRALSDHRKIYGNVLALPEGGRWMTCDGRDTLPTLPAMPCEYYNAPGKT